MLHATFQDYRTLGSREEDFKCFGHIWHGGQFGHMTQRI